MASECDHTSVGILVWQANRLLLIERKLFPFGFAPPAGHVDAHGDYETAAGEELTEEVGLTPISLKLIAQGRKENHCRRLNGNWHYWKIYEAQAAGQIKPSQDETKQASWYSRDQIHQLASRTERYLNKQVPDTKWENSPGIETVWYEWFKQLGII